MFGRLTCRQLSRSSSPLRGATTRWSWRALISGQSLHGDERGHDFVSKRHQSSDSVYLHHATIGAGVNSAAVTLGFFHTLSLLKGNVGYFRPIDSTSHGGHRSLLVKNVYQLPGSIDKMQGCSQEEALAYMAEDRMDELIGVVLKAYDEYRRDHDFVIVEGTNLRDGSNTIPLNATIAAALGSPVLLIADAMAAATGEVNAKVRDGWEARDWETLVLAKLVESQTFMQRHHVGVVGALVYKTPLGTTRGVSTLKEKLEARNVPFAGAIPEDPTLQSMQVLDLKKALGAHMLYGEVTHAGMSTEVTETVVASTQLENLIEYLKPTPDPTKGAVVVTHISRPDILLGCMALHEVHSPKSIAAVILTGGSAPSSTIDALIQTNPRARTLPMLVSDQPTFETCLALGKAVAQFHPGSARKIERAKDLFEDNVDTDFLKEILFKEREVRTNPKMFQYMLLQKAKAAQMHIVLPEGDEPRTIEAAGEVLRRSLAQVTLLGERSAILSKAKLLHVDLGEASIVEPSQSPNLERYAAIVHEARKSKGVTLDKAREMVLDAVYFGTTMVAAGDADGMVSGAVHTTADTVRPALQIVKTSPATPLVSSVFFMCLPDETLVYGDCAINTDPTAEELAMIAISSADTAAAFGIPPRVAMLSYATGDSNKGPLIQKVADATRLAKEKRPDLAIEGPLQYDAAVNPETARTKMKGKETQVAGQATVLIFPDLNTGNNTYKAVQQSTGAVAMGPLLQGLKKPVNDLSRGCTVQDIVTTIALTAVQALGMKERAP
eukprot:TRINITY_DN1157_c1_g5_i1.p1 TRINITY_DN1157_c1_g5~~TRINITY_DN1157_c1_g5_i1.p1  ORF type:complete len:779 (-),score=143.11 TRINITY_DN1157_c1_g5_i1:197-2533(-)